MGRRRDDKLARAAHIKSRTGGTSNEISFSVLDERKQRLDEAVDEADSSPAPLGRIALFTLGKSKEKGQKSQPKGRARRRTKGSAQPGADVPRETPAPRSEADDEAACRAEDVSRETSASTLEPGDERMPDGARALGDARMPDGAHAGDGARASGARAHGVQVPSAHALCAQTLGGAHAGGTWEGGGARALDARKGAAEGLGGTSDVGARVLVEGLEWIGPASKEVSRRKARRRLRRTGMTAAAALVLVAAVGAAGFHLYGYYEENTAGRATLDAAAELLFQTDDLQDLMDAAVVDPFGEGAQDARATAQAGLDAADADLEEAQSLAHAASGELLLAGDREAATQVVVAASARLELFETGEQLLETADEAQAALDSMNAGWDSLLLAADLAAEAAETVTDTTRKNVKTSLKLTSQALEELASARAQIEAAQSLFDIDVSAYLAYIDKKEEALGYAKASDKALLKKKKKRAAEKNDAYNEADAEAAELAELLPEDPADLVSEAYSQAVEQEESDYEQARSEAASADAFIRDYLGE